MHVGTSLEQETYLTSITASPTTRPIVISGPSGAGKSTVLKRLFAEYPTRFMFSVSHTTRQPRAGETDGKDYHFTTVPAFQNLVQKQGFVEHAQFGGNHYGTSVATIDEIAQAGRTPILDIEMEGVKQIKRHPRFASDARFLFLAPPSVEVLETRLRGRGTDKEDAIQRRLAQARNEMEYSRTPGVHDKIVVNEDLDKAYAEVKAFIIDA